MVPAAHVKKNAILLGSIIFDRFWAWEFSQGENTEGRRESLHPWVYWVSWSGSSKLRNFFPAENAGNMPEKPVFWHFLEISSLVFSDFLHKDAY